MSMSPKSLPRKSVTAKELQLRLQQDPAYLQRIADRESKRLQIVEVNARDSLPVLADLEKAGYKLNWVSDLYNQRMDYFEGTGLILCPGCDAPINARPENMEAFVEASHEFGRIAQPA